MSLKNTVLQIKKRETERQKERMNHEAIKRKNRRERQIRKKRDAERQEERGEEQNLLQEAGVFIGSKSLP